MSQSEKVALDPESPVTSTYEIVGPTHAEVTVRWYGKTAGKLIVDAHHVARLRDWLMPGGHK